MRIRVVRRLLGLAGEADVHRDGDREDHADDRHDDEFGQGEAFAMWISCRRRFM